MASYTAHRFVGWLLCSAAAVAVGEQADEGQSSENEGGGLRVHRAWRDRSASKTAIIGRADRTADKLSRGKRPRVAASLRVLA